MNELDQLREENARLKAELAECKRDAARYHFLRDAVGDKWEEAYEILGGVKPISEVDSLIDSAMSKGGEDGN